MGFTQGIYVAVDTVVLHNSARIVLIKRKNEPFKGTWALPGGFVEKEEELVDAAVRELEEETGISAPVEQLVFTGVYGKPGRDPRFRTVSIVYKFSVPEMLEVVGMDDADEARWFALTDLPELAFDHHQVIQDALRK